MNAMKNKTASDPFRWMCVLQRLFVWVFGLSACVMLSGCASETIGTDITGYDHMSDIGIIDFYVDGQWGGNVFPRTGGDGEVCCVSIPKHWHPGMTVHVEWFPARATPGSEKLPPLPPQEATVEIPEYTPEAFGPMQVHFYPGNRVKVIVSRYDAGNPCYPLSGADLAPWTVDNRLIKNYLPGGIFSNAPCPPLEPLRHKGAAQ